MRLEPLAAHELALARPLIDTWECRSHRPLALTLFEGRQAGAVYVDDPARPATALICPANGFYFVCGAARADLLSATLPRIRAELDPKAELYATSSAWARELERLLLGRVERLGFDHPGPAPAAPALPGGFAMVPMTADMADTWNPHGDRSGLDPWIFAIWGGAEAFVERSFGVAVLQDGNPVAFTAACAIAAREAEVEVGTAVASRQRGLATAACVAFMAECARRGLEPTWTCRADNAPSVALAHRLGYRETETVVGFALA